MLGTLRGRFIVSHILPLLVVVPLMGITLTYVLESRVILDNLSNELTGQARLISSMLTDHTGEWADAAGAQSFVTNLDLLVDARIMLLDSDGCLLASSDAADIDQVGQFVAWSGWETVQAGQVSLHTAYSLAGRAEIVNVLAPVMQTDQQLAGAVRLSHELAGVSERFVHVRAWTGGIMAGGLCLGVLVGWVLAVNLARPLRQATDTVRKLSRGEQLEPLPERGPKEIRMLSQSVNSLVQRLQNLEKARRQLLANLIHELGRPLGALLSAVQALRSGADQDAALKEDLLAGMDGEIQRLHRLVDDLTGLHGQVLGSLELQRQPITPARWLAQVLAPWREAAEAEGLRWRVTIPQDLPSVEGDPDRLAQAVGNVLSNAIKFTPPGGTVTISAGSHDDTLWIRIGDTGPGIAPEEQALVFEPFYRGKSGRRFPEGMGLGLSIALDLVTAHQGRLELDSTPGEGSTFTLWLPVPHPES